MNFINNSDIRLVKTDFHLKVLDKKRVMISCGTNDNADTIDYVILERDKMFNQWHIVEIIRKNIEPDIMRGFTFLLEEMNRYEAMFNATR